MTARGLFTTTLVASTLLAAGWASAQSADEASRGEARKIGYAGVEAFQAGDYATAHDRLETAYRLLRVPSLGLWSARALTKLGKLVDAEARYQEVIGLPTSVGDEAIQAQARQDARNERAELARRIPSVLVRIEGAPPGEVAVTIDERPLVGSALGENRLVDPGHHRVEGVRGAVRAIAEVTVAEGERKDAVLRFAAGPAASGSGAGAEALVSAPGGASTTATDTKRTIGWAAVAAGGAGVAVGVVSALVVRSKKNHLDSVGCGADSQMCPAAESDAVDSYNGWRPVPTIGFIAGAVLGGVGAYLLLTTPAAETTDTAGKSAQRQSTFANVRLGVVPGGALLSGAF
jgi:hypothetical protein